MADTIELIDMGAEGEEPKIVEMPATDANHALAADPDRYHRAAAFVLPPTTVEQRLTSLEQRVEALDGYNKKAIEARAAEHQRIIAERNPKAEPSKPDESARTSEEVKPQQAGEGLDG